MAVNVQVISSKYYKQWVNGADFSANTGDYTLNLAGSVMQKIKLVQQISISWSTLYDAPNRDSALSQFYFSQPAATTLKIERADGGSFINDGFNVGDNVQAELSTTSTTDIYDGGTISVLSATEMTIINTDTTAIASGINRVNIYGQTPLTSLIYNYGLIENNDNYNNLSKINSESQGWYSLDEVGAAGMSGRDTTMIEMAGLGVSKAWQNGSCYVGFVSETDYQQTFEIEHEFIIPYFSYGETDDIENNVLPDYLNNGNSLKYVFEADFRTVISNPNTSKKAKVTNVLGSVGWYDENFNGFDSNYELISVDYEDSNSNSADGVLLSDTTQVTVVIEKLVGNFGTDEVGVYFSYLPQLESEVKNTATEMETNFMYDSIFATIGGGAQGGGGILDDCLAVAVTNQLTITFITTLDAAQQLRLGGGGKYVLGFEVGDSTKTAGNSDAVILKSVNSFDVSADIPDLMTCDFEIYPHTQMFVDGGFTSGRAWNEDGFAFSGAFDLDLTKNARIDSMKGLLVAYNSAANSYFILDEYNYQLGNNVANVVGQDYQILDMSATRNYPLISGSEKNGVSVELDLTSVVPPYDNATYEFTFAQKIRWEDWIKNFAANPLFWTAGGVNNNLNYKASNFTTFGYKIRFLFQFNVYGTNDTLGVSGNTIYNFFSNDITVRDYDVDGYTPPRFTQTIETFTSDGATNLGGAIQVGVDTLMKITWTASSGSIVDISDWWGIHRIEVTGQTGQQIYELSSFETNETTNNILKGETTDYLDMAIVFGELVTTCLIDGSKIQSGIDYNLSGRIESPTSPKNRFDIRVTDDGSNRVDLNGDVRVIYQ